MPRLTNQELREEIKAGQGAHIISYEVVPSTFDRASPNSYENAPSNGQVRLKEMSLARHSERSEAVSARTQRLT